VRGGFRLLQGERPFERVIQDVLPLEAALVFFSFFSSFSPLMVWQPSVIGTLTFFRIYYGRFFPILRSAFVSVTSTAGREASLIHAAGIVFLKKSLLSLNQYKNHLFIQDHQNIKGFVAR
jgi:hypothetical protein